MCVCIYYYMYFAFNNTHLTFSISQPRSSFDFNKPII